jgi:hemerythrin-like metal-binding protein
MSYIDWTDDFSVKVEKIDLQHKNLVAMINELHENMTVHKEQSVQLEIVQKMIAYTDYHFKTEEQLMQETDFPGSANHKVEHEKFVKKALEIKERLDKKGLVLSIEILSYLKQWLKHHILNTDKKYSDHFNAHGIK